MRRWGFLTILPLLLLLLPGAVHPQEETEELDRGFGNLELGLSLEETRQRLQGNSNFMYRGAPDVSFRPFDQEESIETEGRGYMERGAFHFFEGELYIITLFLDRERIDYFTLYRTLLEKYGEPSELSPRRASWETAETTVILERPLTVKYIERERFEERIAEGRIEESIRTESRRNFLEQF